MAWFLLAGCKAQEEEKPYGGPDTGPAYGDLFIDASIGDASTLLPPLAMDAASASIISLVYNGLVKYDGNLNLVGDLAESWDISPDGLTITFHLRHGVKWQDGAPFTAKDVLFTYQVMVDPKTPTAYSGDYLQVKKAEAPDDYTFRVTYPQPFAPALGSWGLAILPRHLLAGQDITKSPLGRHPVGTGPYIFKEWRAGEKIALAYNPDYFEGRPYLNGYVYQVKPDTATMFMELKAGNLDRMNLNAIQYTRQTEYPKFKRMYKKYRYMPFSYIYLGYNLNDSRFADRRVRQALTHAINKKEIIEGVLMGLGEEATGPYKPGTWYYNPNVPKFPYDPAKAKALLAAGRLDPQCRRYPHEGRPPLCLHHPHQPGQRYPATHRGDHPEPAPGRRHPGEDPAGGVGRLPQGIHPKGAVRGDPVGLEHRPGPGPVRHLEFHQDQARRAQRHRLQKPRGGRLAVGGPPHL